MSRSQTLFQLQQYDTNLDSSFRRIAEIEILISDTSDLDKLHLIQDQRKLEFDEKQTELRSAENQVKDQNFKIEQNEKKLYGGMITNPKELEDLQLESESLKKYLTVLEERQLEVMLESDQAQSQYDEITAKVDDLSQQKNSVTKDLLTENNNLKEQIAITEKERNQYLEANAIPDLSIYNKLRESLGGIAVTIMTNSSCSSCGANIPSAIEQEARSPGNLSNCPTCKRILHPGMT